MFGGNVQVTGWDGLSVCCFSNSHSWQRLLPDWFKMQYNIWLNGFELYDRFDVRKGPKILLMGQISTRNFQDLALSTLVRHWPPSVTGLTICSTHSWPAGLPHNLNRLPNRPSTSHVHPLNLPTWRWRTLLFTQTLWFHHQRASCTIHRLTETILPPRYVIASAPATWKSFHRLHMKCRCHLHHTNIKWVRRLLSTHKLSINLVSILYGNYARFLFSTLWR
jgi:hypothetical protein